MWYLFTSLSGFHKMHPISLALPLSPSL
ncbi:hypothetical protein CGRA01v4_03057 [Colletotrichum graminicola]|nr:hypothetical protein CGRA01v4_03057 [Colletotrichum graminicola]